MKIERDRIALGAFQYIWQSMDYFLDTAQRLNISRVELYGAVPDLCLPSITNSELNELAINLRKRNIKVCALTPEQVYYPMNLTVQRDSFWQYSMNLTRRGIEAASILESPYLLVTMGHSIQDLPSKDAWEKGIESLILLGEYASKQGVRLLLETLTPLSSDLLNTPEQQREIANRVSKDVMGLMLDIGQMVYMNQSLDRYIEHGNLLEHVHIHDSHPAIHMALGDGDLPICDYIEAIENSGYRGCYSLEQNDPRYRKNPREADENSIRWLENHGII